MENRNPSISETGMVYGAETVSSPAEMAKERLRLAERFSVYWTCIPRRVIYSVVVVKVFFCFGMMCFQSV